MLGPFSTPAWVAEHYRHTPCHWPATAVLPTIRNTFPAALSVNGAAHIIDALAVPGANKICRIGENPAASTDLMPSWRNAFTYQEFSAFWDITNDTLASAANYVGLALGDAAYPFVAAPVTPLIEARWIDAAPWARLYTAAGDGVTPSAVVDAVGISSKGYEGRMWLKINPGISVEFWGLDRDLGVYRKICEQRDPAKLPPAGATWTKGFNLVHATGAVAAGWKCVFAPPTLLAFNL